MKPKVPELLLVLFIFLPMKHPLVAQVLLCQIRSIHIARRAEEKVNLDLENNIDEVWRQFLKALWFNPGNATAHAYLYLLTIL